MRKPSSHQWIRPSLLGLGTPSHYVHWFLPARIPRSQKSREDSALNRGNPMPSQCMINDCCNVATSHYGELHVKQMLNAAVFFKALHLVFSLLKIFQKNLFWEQPLYPDISLARKPTCNVLFSCLTHTPYSICLLCFDLMRLSCIQDNKPTYKGQWLS